MADVPLYSLRPEKARVATTTEEPMYYWHLPEVIVRMLEHEVGKPMELFSDEQLIGITKEKVGEEVENMAFDMLVLRIRSYKQLHDLVAGRSRYEGKGRVFPSLCRRLVAHFFKKAETAEDMIWVFKACPRTARDITRRLMARKICRVATHEQLKWFLRDELAK
jgi:hypothetical protein